MFQILDVKDIVESEKEAVRSALYSNDHSSSLVLYKDLQPEYI